MYDPALDDYLPEELVPPPLDPFTSRIIMAEENWDIEAVVLIIDRRTCTCGRHYDTPNPRVMLRKRRRHHRSRTLHLERLDGDTGLPYDVPRETEYIHSRVEACQGCFKLYEPAGQFEMFPRAKPPKPKPRKTDTADGYVRPLGVEDFL